MVMVDCCVVFLSAGLFREPNFGVRCFENGDNHQSYLSHESVVLVNDWCRIGHLCVK